MQNKNKEEMRFGIPVNAHLLLKEIERKFNTR